MNTRQVILVLLLSLCQYPLMAQHVVDTTELSVMPEALNDTVEVDEQFVLEIDSLWREFHARTNVYEEENCRSSALNPDLPDSIYMQRLAQLPRLIEMPYNGIVRNHIDFYLVRHRDWVELIAGLGRHLFPIFEQELDAQGLPLELKYLPVIESALNPNAVSRMGATGVWQLMLGTARGLGMDVNSLIDERRDPVHATQTAVAFLKTLHEIYGDWNLAIAAYNCGPGNVNRAIRSAGNKRDFWSIYFYLPRETRGYVPAFIAANYVMEYYKEHGICAMKNPYPAHCDTVVVNRMIHFEQVSELLNIPINQIKQLNPMYRKQIVPGNIKPYSLLLPADMSLAFSEMYDSIGNHRQDELLVNIRRTVDPSAGQYKTAYTDSVLYHKVQKGQTLATIASKYKTTPVNLRNWNGLRTTRIREGQNLLVFVRNPARQPVATSSQSSASSNKKLAELSVNKDGKTIHTVRNGDSLWKIANAYSGVSVNDILRANNLTSSVKLNIGQQLVIPVD